VFQRLGPSREIIRADRRVELQWFFCEIALEREAEAEADAKDKERQE
jgi:hypothetical protein